MGLETSKKGKVFLIDFGLARRYVLNTGEVRPISFNELFFLYFLTRPKHAIQQDFGERRVTLPFTLIYLGLMHPTRF